MGYVKILDYLLWLKLSLPRSDDEKEEEEEEEEDFSTTTSSNRAEEIPQVGLVYLFHFSFKWHQTSSQVFSSVFFCTMEKGKEG